MALWCLLFKFEIGFTLYEVREGFSGKFGKSNKHKQKQKYGIRIAKYKYLGCQLRYKAAVAATGVE